MLPHTVYLCTSFPHTSMRRLVFDVCYPKGAPVVRIMVCSQCVSFHSLTERVARHPLMTCDRCTAHAVQYSTVQYSSVHGKRTFSKFASSIGSAHSKRAEKDPLINQLVSLEAFKIDRPTMRSLILIPRLPFGQTLPSVSRRSCARCDR